VPSAFDIRAAQVMHMIVRASIKDILPSSHAIFGRPDIYRIISNYTIEFFRLQVWLSAVAGTGADAS
jgi:hypothetical protein